MFIMVLSTRLSSNLLTLLLPHFTYPVVHIASTASTIMTVALAHERYLAVQSPIVYSQMLRRASAQRRRLAMHVLPVLLFAILFNMPTFWCVENVCIPYVDKYETLNSTEYRSGTNLVNNTLYSITPAHDSRKDVTSTPSTMMEISYSISELETNNRLKATQHPTFGLSEQAMAKKRDLDQSKSTTQNDLVRIIITDENQASDIASNTEGAAFDSNCEQLTFRFTKFRSHPYFLLFYQNLARLIILGILPFVMLIFFNCSIYFAIRRRQGNRANNVFKVESICLNKVDKYTSFGHAMFQLYLSVRQRHQEENMAIVLMGIVSIFLVCNSFRIFLNFYEAVYEINTLSDDDGEIKSEPISRSQWFRNASILSNFFVTLNACCNLIIYCALNNQFRSHFLEVLSCCKIPCFTLDPREEAQRTRQQETRRSLTNRLENTHEIVTVDDPTNGQATVTTEIQLGGNIESLELVECSKSTYRPNNVNGNVDFV